MLRTALGLATAGAVAAIGGLVLGEFAFSGVSVIASAAVLGLLVAEAAVSAARQRSWLLTVAAATLTALALVAAAWVFTGHRLAEVEVSGWAAVVAGPVVAALRARPPSRPGGSPTNARPPE